MQGVARAANGETLSINKYMTIPCQALPATALKM